MSSGSETSVAVQAVSGLAVGGGDGSGPVVPSAVLADAHPTPTHCGISIHTLYSGLLYTLLPLVVSGLVFTGWRGMAAMGVVLASTMVGVLVWRLVGQRGRSLNFSHAIYLALLLAVMMPADLARPTQAGDMVVARGSSVAGGKETGVGDAEMVSRTIPSVTVRIRSDGGWGGGWPLLVAAGFTLATFYWLCGGVGSRIHPVAVTVALLICLFSAGMTPSLVLTRPHLIFGDLLSSRAAPAETAQDPALFTIYPRNLPPAMRTEPASLQFYNFSQGNLPPDASWLSIDTFLRDRLPPLEDLILGGHPGPLGLSSMAAVLLGGLLLLFRGGADWRVPLLTLGSAFAAFLCLRVPLVITDSGPIFRYFAFRPPSEGGAGLSTMTVYALYQIAAGPLVFTSLFLATSAASCPTSRRGRVIYAVLLGVLSAVLQTYFTVAVGPLGALLVLSLVAPVIDRVVRPKPLL